MRHRDDPIRKSPHDVDTARLSQATRGMQKQDVGSECRAMLHAQLHPAGSSQLAHADPPWTIILAGGRSKRLESLVRALHGKNLPKQFAYIQEHQSLLQAAVSRTAHWSPAGRTVIVVDRENDGMARAQVSTEDTVEIIAQPRNLGTGPELLLPLAHILAQDCSAHVVVIRADHYVRNEDTLVASVRRALSTSRSEDEIALVGAVAEYAESQYEWIVGEPRSGQDTMLVKRFIKKPSGSNAEHLLNAGALWNTFIMSGLAWKFWALASRHLPQHWFAMDAYRRSIAKKRNTCDLLAIYDEMSPADLFRDILHKTDQLRVVPMPPCGWSDWGTPQRVLRSFGEVEFAQLLSRLRRPMVSPPLADGREARSTKPRIGSEAKSPGALPV